jgi:hypothetical protein
MMSFHLQFHLFAFDFSKTYTKANCKVVMLECVFVSGHFEKGTFHSSVAAMNFAWQVA